MSYPPGEGQGPESQGPESQGPESRRPESQSLESQGPESRGRGRDQEPTQHPSAPLYAQPPHDSYPPYGQPPGYPPPYGRPSGINIMAVLSLVFAFVFPPAGIVLGHVAKRQIRATGQEGGPLATWGLGLSYALTALSVLACCAGVALIVAGVTTRDGNPGY